MPLDASRYCGRRRSMLAGRGAVGGGRAEVTGGSGDACPPPGPGPPTSSPLLQGRLRCSSCSLVSDLLREQWWGLLSSDWGQGRLVGLQMAPPWPQGTLAPGSLAPGTFWHLPLLLASHCPATWTAASLPASWVPEGHHPGEAETWVRDVNLRSKARQKVCVQSHAGPD